MSQVARALSAVVGVSLFSLGAYIIVRSHAPMVWRIGGGAVLMALGGNLLYTSYRRTRSWVSRIGPLP